MAFLPWRPWSIEDTFDQLMPNLKEEDLSEITIIIPARNEAYVIQNTMIGLTQQGHLSSIIIVDDQSTDDTLNIVKFYFFFRMLYPFRLSNKLTSTIAAGPGGCILVKTQALKNVGAFESLRNALIDDCTLAKKIKQAA
jgi:cellulose synthase/poly-beta-1,6-N-acetylglucosamine synthase-like glycosyltransferase